MLGNQLRRLAPWSVSLPLRAPQALSSSPHPSSLAGDNVRLGEGFRTTPTRVTSPQALHSALFSLAQQEHLRRLTSPFPSHNPKAHGAHATVGAEESTRPSVEGELRASEGPADTSSHPAPTVEGRSLPHSPEDTSAIRGDSSNTTTTVHGGEDHLPVGSESALLHRLLLRKREARRLAEAAAPTATQAAAASKRGRMSKGSEVAQVLHRRVQDAKQDAENLRGPAMQRDEDGALVPATHDATASGENAAWFAALRLFSEAIHNSAVTPTAQHFNLLLGLVIQENLFAQADQVEDFYARFLYSTQELRAEKQRKLDQLSSAPRQPSINAERCPTPADVKADEEVVAQSVDHTGPATRETSSLSSDSRQSLATQQQQQQLLHSEITELAVIESALRPNKQTFDLLMQASLQRGAWPRVLEYLEHCLDSGVAVGDAQVRMVLQACLLGGARTLHVPDDSIHEAAAEEGDAVAATRRKRPTRMNPHGISEGRTRLLTSQRGPALHAAAQPLTRSPYSGSGPIPRSSAEGDPLWSVGLSLFSAHRHVVNSPQTVWLMMKLLLEGGQAPTQAEPRPSGDGVKQSLLLRVYEDCQHLLPNEFPSGFGTAADDEAAMRAHLAASAAAREEGHWPLAVRLWQAAARSWQLHFAQPSIHSMPFTATHSRPSAAREGLAAAASSHPHQHQPQHNAAGLNSLTGGTALEQYHEPHAQQRQLSLAVQQREIRERVKRYAQELLVNALHSLRRVRRYKELLARYHDASHHERDVQALWTPRAVAFVAQAAMAEQDLDLLLELVGLSPLADHGEQHGTPFPPHPPVEAFDAALRTIQVSLITGGTLSGSVQSRSKAESESLIGVARSVYQAFLHNALRETRALERFQKTESDVHELLPAAHLPLVQLWTRAAVACSKAASSLPTLGLSATPAERDSQAPPEMTPQKALALGKEALTCLHSVRRPDTVVLALAMDVVRMAAECFHQCEAGNQGEASWVASSLLAFFRDMVTDAESRLGERSGREEDGGGDGGGNSRRVRLALALTTVTGPCVESATAALTLLGQPFAALSLLTMAAAHGWLPASQVSSLQVTTHHEALEAAQRALRRAETEAATAADVVASVGAPTSAPYAERVALAPVDDTKRQRSESPCGPSLAPSSHAAVGALVALASLYTTPTEASWEESGTARTARTLCASLVGEAVAVMHALQATGQRQPPTAAVAALLDHLQEAHADGQREAQQQELHVATVVIVNAVVQQISVTATSRWALWPLCVKFVQLLDSPLRRFGRTPFGTEEATTRPSPTEQTIKVLASLVRYSDKAEVGLVEALALQWLAGTDGETANRGHFAPRRAQVDCAAEAESPTHEKALELLLDCVVWACRHREKSLVRKLLRNPVVANLVFPSHPASSLRLPTTTGPLRAAVASTLTVVLQCLSSGDHRDVVRDWPSVSRALRFLHTHCAAQQPLTDVALPNLLDSIAAVLEKLQRSLCFLLRSMAFDTHRWACASEASTPASPSSPPMTAEYMAAVESAVDEFLTICEEQFISSVMASTYLALTAAVLPTGQSAKGGLIPVDGMQRAMRSQELSRAALVKSLNAAWEVLFAQFVWKTAFITKTTPSPGPDKLLAYGSDARRRARSLMLITVSIADSPLAASPLPPHHPHLRKWVVMQSVLLCLTPAPSPSPACARNGGTQDTGERVAPMAARAVTALCGDVTTLESLQGAHSSLEGCSERPSTPAGRRGREQPHWCPPLKAESAASIFVPKREKALPRHAEPADAATGSSQLLLQVLFAIDGITTELLHPPETRAQTEYPTKEGSRSRLPPLPDGTTSPAALFSHPAASLDAHLSRVQCSVPPLRLLHETGLQLFYMALCEGNEALLRDHPALVRRVLAWSASLDTSSSPPTSRFVSVLHALEAAGLPVLRSPDAIAEVFRHMASVQTWWAARPTAVARCDAGAHASLLLSFLMTSKTFMGLSSLSESAATEALLCLSLPPPTGRSDSCTEKWQDRRRQVSFLLQAFPSLPLTTLLPRWQSGALANHQKQFLDAWARDSLPRPSTASTPSPSSPRPTPLVVRRCAVVWLLGTRGKLPDAEAPSASPSSCVTQTESGSPGIGSDTVHVSRAAAAAVSLAVSGEQAWMRLLSIPAQDLLRCYRGQPTPQILMRRCRAMLRHHYGAALADDQSLTSSPGDGQAITASAHASFDDEWVTRLLHDTLSRSATLRLLALCFPSELHQHNSPRDGERAAGTVVHQGLPLHLPMFREPELEALMTLARARLTEAARSAIVQANTLRQSEAVVLQALEQSVHGQRSSGFSAEARSPSVSDGQHTANTLDVLAIRVAHVIRPQGHPPARQQVGQCGQQETLTALLTTVGEAAAKEDGVLVSSWAQACEWLRQRLARTTPALPTPAPSVAAALAAIEDFLTTSHDVRYTDDGSHSQSEALHFLVLLLDANGRSVVDVCLARYYVHACIPLLREAISPSSGPPGTGRAPGGATTLLKEWERRVKWIFGLVLAHLRQRELCPLGSSHLERSTAVLGLRRVLADIAAIRLAWPSTLDGSVYALAQEMHRYLGSDVERVLSTSSSSTMASDHVEVVRAWVQGAVLLGAWKDLQHLSGKQQPASGAVEPLGAACVISSLARPSSFTANVGPSAESSAAQALGARLRKSAARTADAFTKYAHRQPNYVERLILSAAVPTAIQLASKSQGSSVSAGANSQIPLLFSEMWVELAASCAGEASDCSPAPPQSVMVGAPCSMTVREAVAVLQEATPQGFAAFARLESLHPRRRRGANGDQAGTAIQQAWRVITEALAANPCDSGIPHDVLKHLFLQLSNIPHTKHYIPVAFSEALILHSCDTVTEALRLIQFSLSTLARSGGRATPVQQYMVYLALRRVRLHTDPRAGSKGPIQPFREDDLESFQYAVPGGRGTKTGLVAVVYKCYELLTSSSAEASVKSGTESRGREALPQFLFTELLRASVADAELTMHLYEAFSRQSYSRLEGVNVFLSLLRAARMSHREDVALRAMRDFHGLLLHSSGVATSDASRSPSPISTPAGAAAVLGSAVDLPCLSGAAQESDGGNDSGERLGLPSHGISAENRRMVWKAFASVCRGGAVGEAAARRVVDAFRSAEPPLITDVEELLVLANYYPSPRSE